MSNLVHLHETATETEMPSKGFLKLELAPKLLFDHNEGPFRTLVFGFTPHSFVALPLGYTHLGLVVSGEIVLTTRNRERKLHEGDFFSVTGSANIKGNGHGMVSSRKGYDGMNLYGGPLDPQGKLRYINGCTDTLLVPPVRKGDACLNHLHFPKMVVQTPHTHPSIRVNIVYRGSGVCVLPDEKPSEIPLVPGYAFVMLPETVHSFNTEEDSMDVITYHPDSDTGMTDDDHPMVNRTIVDGVSANTLPEIRTQAQSIR